MRISTTLLWALTLKRVAAFAPSSLSIVQRRQTLTTLPAFKRTNEQVFTASDLCNKIVRSCVLASVLAFSNVPVFHPSAARAVESHLVGEIEGSGIFFKDTLNVESFDDPKVKGVTLYISNFQRPLTERIQKNFFSDPSFASVGCAKTGPVSIADNIAIGKGGEEVFEEARSLLFKKLRVQRLYDKDKNTVVYVTYNTRLDKNSDDNKSRFKSSTCVVSLD